MTQVDHHQYPKVHGVAQIKFLTDAYSHLVRFSVPVLAINTVSYKRLLYPWAYVSDDSDIVIKVEIVIV